MRFKGKAPEYVPESCETVYDEKLNVFYEFRGNVFETQDEAVIARLNELGYGSVEATVQTNPFKCRKCEFVAKNNTGLSAHERSHKENQ